MAFVSALRRFSRLKEIVQLLGREGFAEVLSRVGLRSALFGAVKEKQVTPGEHIAVRLRRVMEDAGGAFVKIGQMLSLRTDLLPQEYCDEFAKLQDTVKPISFTEVKRVIEGEYHKPLKDLFAQFDEKPLASASVGQVHRAKLKSGPWVAVKVQRPEIARQFAADIDLLHYLAKEAEEHLPEIRPYKPQKIVEEFDRYTNRELDYLLEAKSITIFAEKFKGSQTIKIPKVYWELTTSRVLTMEFIDGKKISEVTLTKDQKKKIARSLYNCFVTQFFDLHVFHADPHPGNIFFLKNGKIGLLDFGIIGRVSPDLTQHLEKLIIGWVQGDFDLVAEGFIDIGVVESIDEEQFKEDLFEVTAPYHGVAWKDLNMARFFSEGFTLARKYNMEYPGNFVLLTKALITIQSVGQSLYPESNFVEIYRPWVEKTLRERRKPATLYHSAKKTAYAIGTSLVHVPQDLRTLIHILKRGPKINVDFHHDDLRQFTLELDRSSNRIAYGVIISGLTVGAGLVILAGIQPKFIGIPLFAWVIFLIIGILSLALTGSIYRERKGGRFE